MKIEPNLLRSQAEDFEHTTTWYSTKQLERRDRIVSTGRHLMALHGLRNLRICDLAIAMSITSASIRMFFADLDALLIHILGLHMQAINKALGDIPQSDPDVVAKRRAAYLAITRGPYGNLTEAHLLLTRDATMLSDANYAAIRDSHDQHAIILAGALDADTALTLLDAPRLDPARILVTIATIEGTDPALLLHIVTRATAAEPAPVELAPLPFEPCAEPRADLVATDGSGEILDDPFAPYPNGQTPGAWVFNPGHARAPPHAA